MTRHTQMFLGLLAAASLTTSAAAQEQPDLTTWECSFCPEVEEVSGWLMIGIGTVSGQAYKFADYTGLEDGGFGVGDGYGRYITDQQFWRFQTSNLFLDSRELSVEGGKPGTWWLDVEYDEIVRFDNETGATPFLGAGTGDLTLPEDWVFGIGTGGLTALDTNLRTLELASDRTRYGLGIEFTPPGKLEYALSYKRETREGSRRFAGANMFVGSLLPAPVDYVTDEVRASMTYLTDTWQASVSYYGSFFENDTRSFTWEVPFRALIRGSEVGRFDLGPDSEYHLISLSGHYRFSPQTRATAQLSFGQMQQDDTYLPYTTNPFPQVGALPRASLDGEVDVFDFVGRISTEVLNGLGLEATYRLNDRDNQSPVDFYTPVTMDLYANAPLANAPFSYQKQVLALEADQRFGGMAHLYGGADFTDTERTFDQRADTDETELWSKLRVGFSNGVEASLKLSAAERDGAVLEPVAGVNLAENPAIRKYNYADRDRNEAQASISAMPTEQLQVTLSGAYAEDDYTDSPIGLTGSDYTETTLDVAWMPTANTTLHAFYSREDFDTEMAGEQSLTGNFLGQPNWFATLDDRIRTGGAGVAFENIAEKDLSFSIDYVISNADSTYDVRDGSGAPAFPDFRTRMDGLRLRASYPLPGGARLHVEYYREDFESDDWTIDGLGPDTLGNLLALGELAHNYNVDTFAIWYRRPF